ncbi:uncharacterized protein [Littorina saxatilis]|uniref:uncharacterized protein n=1 Tax=Littorina saxatilis TaxID=31220 RepID=UPI0038B5EC10
MTKVVGSVVAVFGIILMSMTMPIMVSNFNSLYINAVVGRPSAIEKARREIGHTSHGSSMGSDAENGLDEEAAKGETSCLEAAKERCAKCCLSLRACLSRTCKVAFPPAEKNKSDAEEERRTFSGDEADDESDSGNSSADDTEKYFHRRWNRSGKVTPHNQKTAPLQGTVATRRLLQSKVCDTAAEEDQPVGLLRRRFALISDGVPLLAGQASPADES